MIASLLLAAWTHHAVAAPPAKKVLPGLLIDIKTVDGWTLKGKHLPAREGNKTFLLLHGTGQRKEDWYPLARGLAGWGYGYFALDFRGHGESSTGPDGNPASWRKFKVTKTENEYANTLRDVEASVAYLIEQGLSLSSIGVIGADVGSSIGLKYAAVHPDVPQVVMLSPGTHYQEVLTVNAMRAYKSRPILMIYSEADRSSAKATPLLAVFARQSAGEKNTTVLTVEHEHGIKMLRRHRDLIPKIIDWIANSVRPPEDVEPSTFTTQGQAEPYPQPDEQ